MTRKVFYFLLFTFYFAIPSVAQITSGLTGIPDTSYSIQSEYFKHIKKYPFISIAKDSGFFVNEEHNIAYCNPAGRTLNMNIFYEDIKPGWKLPAIIFIHGGGWRSGSYKMHNDLLRKVAAMGYVCFAPEYRLSTEALYPAAIHDIKSAIRWVRQHAKKYSIDPDKIVIAGHSAGGELASFVASTNRNKEFEGEGCNQKTSSEVNALINLDGTLAFIHPESGEGDDSKKISAATYWFGFSKTENPGLWKNAAPLTHVGKKNPPALFINSSVDRMHAGRDDFTNVLNRFHIYNETRTLVGAPHTFLFFHPWFDTTAVYMDRFIRKIFPGRQKIKKFITVAKDGTGDFNSVNKALDYLRANRNQRRVVYIKKGIYEEKILVDSTLHSLDLIGEDYLNTVLTYNDHTGKISPSGDTINTRTSWSVKILADEFTAKDITFRNDAGFSAGQAVAVESDGNKINFTNCRFIGNQDVLFTNNDKSKQVFRRCYIEGTTDFIFGSSTAWFERCIIYSKKNSHITAASTPQENEYGYVFSKCILLGDTSLHNVSLGRPWRPYANVIYMNCYLGPHIKPEGWSNWNNTENYKTTRFAEYKNFGPGANFSKRLPWIRHLTTGEARDTWISTVLGLDKWY